jgi:hypothetical protein
MKMEDYLNISEERRKNIEETVDSLFPPETLDSHETHLGFYSYCDTLSPVERLFAVECGSKRVAKNVAKQAP